MDSMGTDQDYLNILLSRLEICKSYLPRFGQGSTRGLTWNDFESLYRNDAFYHWFGLDTPLMYSAHRAAGGITSIYRQIGIGCEELIRQIIQDQLNLTATQTKWIYTVETTAGKNRALSLDARIELDDIADPLKKQRVREWILQASAQLNISPTIAQALRGVVFEIRQGYKSKDSKRQNADLANAANAYAQGLFTCRSRTFNPN
jgi:hypothetical protein